MKLGTLSALTFALAAPALASAEEVRIVLWNCEKLFDLAIRAGKSPGTLSKQLVSEGRTL